MNTTRLFHFLFQGNLVKRIAVGLVLGILVANGKNKNSFLNFILSIVTCGIFYLVWNYKLGQEVEDFGGKDEGVLYLFLAFFSFGIISIALAQSQVNQICERNGIS